MRITTTTAAQLVIAHKGLIEAHEAAEAFHYAMAEAISAQREIAAEKEDAAYAGDDYWQKLYTEMLVKAAVALQKMPSAWAAILTADIEEQI